MNTKTAIETIRKLAQELKTVSNDSQGEDEQAKVRRLKLAFDLNEACNNYVVANEQTKKVDKSQLAPSVKYGRDLEKLWQDEAEKKKAAEVKGWTT